MTGQLLPVQVTCIGQLGVPKPAYAQLITVHTEASVQLGTCVATDLECLVIW